MLEKIQEWLLKHYGQEGVLPSTGLERTQIMLHEILPRLNQRTIITICGTNGKGETTHHLAGFLKNESFLMWTSPHISRITERFVSQDGEIEPEKLWELIEFCHAKVLSHQWKVSYYEFLFFVFCTWTMERNPKFLLLEVGLGGRLDSVNALDACMVLLPSISRDHQELLGNRYDLILQEKLGVLRKNAVLIHMLETNYLAERAMEKALNFGAKVLWPKENLGNSSTNFSLRNFTLALKACEVLGISSEDQKHSQIAAPLENRGERIVLKNEYHFFGSHNVDGMRKLIQFLRCGHYNFSIDRFDVVIVAFSKRNLKDVRWMLRILKYGELGKIIVTTFDHPKAMGPDELAPLCSQEGIDFVKHFSDIPWEESTGKKILITGSYYFLGATKSRLVR